MNAVRGPHGARSSTFASRSPSCVRRFRGCIGRAGVHDVVRCRRCSHGHRALMRLCASNPSARDSKRHSAMQTASGAAVSPRAPDTHPFGDARGVGASPGWVSNKPKRLRRPRQHPEFMSCHIAVIDGSHRPRPMGRFQSTADLATRRALLETARTFGYPRQSREWGRRSVSAGPTT
jgi:hypothetical protein